VSLDFRRIAMWASGVSFALLVAFILFMPDGMEEMGSILDPEKENVARLEAGESAAIDLVDSHYYAALRVVGNGDDPSADLRLVDDGGETEIEGGAPGWLDTDRLIEENGPTYRPIRIFIVPDSASYTLHNEGDSTLWLVDDYASQIEIISNPTILAMFGSCCFSLIAGLIAIIFATLAFRSRSKAPKQQVSGVVIEGRVMTTDELFRAQQQNESSADEVGIAQVQRQSSNVPDPFVGQSTEVASQPPNKTDSSTSKDGDQGGESWRGWDEG
jgi:hypothetical protein